MGYEHILAARKRLAQLGVPHLWDGGDLGGSFDPGTLVGGGGGGGGDLTGGLGGDLAGGLGQVGNVGGPSSWGDFGAKKTGLGRAVGGIYGGLGTITGGAKWDPTEWGKKLSGLDPFKGGGMLGAAQSDFKGVAPTITQTDFAPNMAKGIAGYDTGQGNLNDSYGAQVRTAAGLGAQQTGLQNVYGQQQNLANALLAQSRGQGPNPSQEQFRQNVDRNIAQQAGAIASQKGINPALAARMIAEEGANANQQAAGQQAVLGAQQQLAAQGALQNQYGLMGQNVLGQANVGAQQAGLYGQAAGTAAEQARLGQGLYGSALGGQGAQNQVLTQGSLGAQNINKDIAVENLKAKTANRAGIMGGIGSGLSMLGSSGLLGKAASGIGSLFGGGGADVAGGGISMAEGGGDVMAGGDAAETIGEAGTFAAHGGAIEDAPKHKVGKVDEKALSLAHALMAMGGQVPGTPRVPGNSLKNDVIPTVLSPKEIVLPNSITQAPDAPQRAAKFVEQLKSKAHPTYGRVIQARNAFKKAQDVHKRACGGMA